MVYEGWKSLLERCQIYERGKRKLNPVVDEVSQYKELIDTWMKEVAEADIMLTTFGTVQMDWDVAPPPMKRARRSCATYVEKVRPLSALLLCHWHRVAIDEIQELDIASASKTANMIKTIKRDHSLAISGTPAKASVQDLASSLSFLGVRMPTHVWNRIVTPAYSKAFHAIFRNIAIRHPKSSLSAEELTIPPQQRLLVPIKLSSIEWAVSSRQCLKLVEIAADFLFYSIIKKRTRITWTGFSALNMVTPTPLCYVASCTRCA